MPAVIAVHEMQRLHHASAWSPLAKATRRKVNGSVTRYTFEDGSVLAVYNNGDAAWISQKFGIQRWRGWHRCNTAS